ncbi:MAG: hypothetical protein LC775_01900 [Acidobacteria bacterium]|nr:hypothetical protein [Acidobacteriota bacterium]
MKLRMAAVVIVAKSIVKAIVPAVSPIMKTIMYAPETSPVALRAAPVPAAIASVVTIHKLATLPSMIATASVPPAILPE